MQLVRIDQVATPFEEEPDLRRHFATVRRRARLGLAVFGIVTSLGIGVSFLMRPAYRATAKVVVPTSGGKAGRADSAAAAEIENAAAPRAVSLSAQAEELMSEESVAAALRSAGFPPDPHSGLKVKVEAPQLTGSDVLTIAVTWDTADGASRLANSLAQLHTTRMGHREANALRRAAAFMRREVERARGETERARAALERLQQRYPLRQLAVIQDERIKRQGEARTRLSEVRSSISSLQAQLATYRKKLAQEPRDLARPVRKDNPERLLLQDRLRQLKVERLQLLKDFQPVSPEVQAVDEQIQDFTRQLAAEPMAVTEVSYAPNPRYQMLEERVAQLEADLHSSRETYEAVSSSGNAAPPPSDFSAAEARQATLAQDAARAAQRADDLADRLQALQLRLDSQSPAARVIQAAVPPASPVAPLRPLLWVLSILAGAGSALAAAFLVNYLDDRVHRPEDLEGPLRLPTLGCVPNLPVWNPLVQPDQPGSGLEAYRGIRSNISFAGLDQQLHRIQVTSTAPGEGKSLTAVNLAITMALDGKKVILVDADLRSPSVHRLLEVEQAPGLSDVLGGDQRIDLALQSTHIPNLRVLAAGSANATGTELLGSANFRFAIEHLERSADYLVFDSSSCTVSDPLVTANRMDGVILVVEAGQTRRAEARRAFQLLRGARARILGVVYNRARREDPYEVYPAWTQQRSHGPASHSPQRESSPETGATEAWWSDLRDVDEEWPDFEVPEEWLERGPGAPTTRSKRSNGSSRRTAPRALRAGREWSPFEEEEHRA